MKNSENIKQIDIDCISLEINSDNVAENCLNLDKNTGSAHSSEDILKFKGNFPAALRSLTSSEESFGSSIEVDRSCYNSNNLQDLNFDLDLTSVRLGKRSSSKLSPLSPSLNIPKIRKTNTGSNKSSHNKNVGLSSTIFKAKHRFSNAKLGQVSNLDKENKDSNSQRKFRAPEKGIERKEKLNRTPPTKRFVDHSKSPKKYKTMTEITKYSDRVYNSDITLDHHQEEKIKETICLDKILNDNKINKGFVEWQKGSTKCLKGFILQSKEFAKTIKEARSQKKPFVRHESFLISVDPSGDSILPTDLTKQRFLALCHWMLYEDGDAEDKLFKSPLIMRAEIDSNCPLSKIQCLLGIGYQFIRKKYLSSVKASENIMQKKVYFFGAYLLDYLSKTSTNVPEDERINMDEVTLKDYIMDPSNGGKGVVFASYRNLGLGDLFETEEFIESLVEWSGQVKIGRFGGKAREKIIIAKFRASEEKAKENYNVNSARK